MMQASKEMSIGSKESDVCHTGGVVVDQTYGSTINTDLKNALESMITGRDTVDSPTLSRTSSDSDEIIDHTAALLGFMDDSDEDDLREISGFSPAISLDLELEPIGDEDERHATFEKVFSGDEFDEAEAPSNRVRNVTPMQLNFVPKSEKHSVHSHDELQNNNSSVKHGRGTNQNNGKLSKSVADDVPVFYFDSRLVVQAVEEYGQRKRTDIDNKRKQAALKAKALKDKATSAISHKAKKAMSVPHAMWDKKVRKSHDEINHQHDKDTEHSGGIKRASNATFMKLKVKAAFHEKAKTVKEKMSLPKSLKERKPRGSEVVKEDVYDSVYSKMYGSIKLSSLVTPPIGEYMGGLSTKSGITVLGGMNQLVKQGPGFIPAITACPSNVSSNNSQIIDEDGFIISPTSSIDLISPVTSFDNVEELSSVASPRSIVGSKCFSTKNYPSSSGIGSPGSITSLKANRGELPPLGKKPFVNQMSQKKERFSKMTLKSDKAKSHRRTTTASF